MSRVLERRRENWRGVRIGAEAFDEDEDKDCEGKMEMWRGLFCLVLVCCGWGRVEEQE